MLHQQPVSEIKVDQLTPDPFIVDNIRNLISCQLQLRRAREKDDEQKLLDWKERKYEQLRAKQSLIEEQEVCSVSELTSHAPDNATQHGQPPPTTRAAESNIVYKINTVENFQIGNNNTMVSSNDLRMV